MLTCYYLKDDPFSQRALLAIYHSGLDVDCHALVLASDLPEAYKGKNLPCLVTEDDVLDNSLEIMDWVLDQMEKPLWTDWDMDQMDDSLYLIELADHPFHDYTQDFIDAPHSPEGKEAQGDAAGFLFQLDGLLQESTYFLQDSPLVVDVAIFPFVQRFAEADPMFWYHLDLPNLKAWLHNMMSIPSSKAVFKDEM